MARTSGIAKNCYAYACDNNSDLGPFGRLLKAAQTWQLNI